MLVVIKSFKHKGLRRYFETGSKAGIQTKFAGRLRLQLAALDTAQVIEDMDVPGYRLHSRSAVSPEMALRLSKALGRSPESWLAMQDNYDLWQARKSSNLSQVRKIPFEAIA